MDGFDEGCNEAGRRVLANGLGLGANGADLEWGSQEGGKRKVSRVESG
jgi:hypothetical protein